MKRTPGAAFLVSILFLSSALSCSDDPTNPSSDRTPASIAVVSGDDQTGETGSTLLETMVVRVTDSSGAALGSITVAWSAESGGGSLTSATSVTESNGQTENLLTLGNTPGPNTVRATVQGSALSALFTATATAPPQGPDTTPASIEIVAGNNQTAPVGTALNAFEVLVKNAAGAGIFDVEVIFTITQGGGQFLLPSNPRTNPDGRALTDYQLGQTPGVNTIEAVVATDPSLSVTFTATGT